MPTELIKILERNIGDYKVRLIPAKGTGMGLIEVRPFYSQQWYAATVEGVYQMAVRKATMQEGVQSSQVKRGKL